MNWEGMELSILLPAFAAGLLVLLSHVPLGMEVLKRGIIFVDLAIAQIAGLGLTLAATLGFEAHGRASQAIALASALTGALIIHWLERRFANVLEAIIGVVFVLAATGSLLLLSNNPHGGEHIKDLLSGQILWADTSQLQSLGLVSAVIAVLWLLAPHHWRQRLFYPIFALAVTSSVQVVGVYLVFSSLIIPALATIYLEGKKRTWTAYAIGLLGYALGLWLSVVFDLPSGALIVWILALTGSLFALLSGAKPAATTKA